MISVHRTAWGFLATALLLVLPVAGARAQQNAPVPAIELYQEGLDAQNADDFYKAIEYYKTALQQNSHYKDPYVGLAESYFAIGEYQEALVNVKQAEVFDRENVDLQNLEGRIRIGLGDLTTASSLFQGVLKKQPNNLDAQFGFAEIDIAQGNTGHATTRFLDALRVSPDNRRALLSLVLLFDEQGDTARSESFAERALQYYPANPQVHYIVGRHFARTGDYKDAEFQAKVALQLNPNYLDATLLLSDIYLKTGSYAQVVTLIENILSKNRNEQRLWYTLGKAYSLLGKTDNALNAYATAFQIEPDDEISRIALENLIIKDLPMNDPRRATYANYHFTLGQAYQSRNYLDRALREYRRGLLINPHSKNGRLLYAQVFNTLGFPAKYLDELLVLKNLGLQDTSISDQIEIEQSLLASSVSNNWNVDQYALPRDQYKVAFFTLPSTLLHYLAGPDLSKYLVTSVAHHSNIDVLSDAQQVDGYGTAFATARSMGADYFYTVSYQEADRSFSVQCTMYSGLAGTKLTSFSILRTGNNRVTDALETLSDDIESVLPARASLVKRSFDTGLINLGSYDGLKKNDVLLIIKNGSLSLKRNQIGFDYAPTDVLGKFTVTNTDEVVAEGTIERSTFFDLINIGDELIFEKQKSTAAPTSTTTSTTADLFQSVLKIQ